MAKEIFWSASSEIDFSHILEYLNHEWNLNVVNHFIDLTEHCIEQISINPKQFPIIHKK